MKRKPSISGSVSKPTKIRIPSRISKLEGFLANASDAITFTAEESALWCKRIKVVARLRVKYPKLVIYMMSDEILNSLDENDPVLTAELLGSYDDE
jgi:hypothetical protein